MIPILYEDDCLIVFDKPAGLLVIPAGHQTQTLTAKVNAAYKKDHPQETCQLHPCHRLDRDTTGCILFAKGKKNQQRLMALFQEKAVRKLYIAVVHGRIKRKKGTLDKSILALEKRRYRSKPQKARTKYTVLQYGRGYTIVQAEPVTGRTNQIRIHFSQIGHPLVGERKYAFARDYALKFKRTALHAEALQFQHPVTHQHVNVVSTLPKDMEVFCEPRPIKGK